MKFPWRIAPLLAALLLLPCAPGCGDNSASAVQDPVAHQSPEDDTQPTTTAPVDDATPAFVAKVADRFPELALQSDDANVVSSALKELLEKDPKRGKVDRLRWRDELRQIYLGAQPRQRPAERDRNPPDQQLGAPTGHMYLASGGSLTESGKLVLETLEGADMHALDPGEFVTDKLKRSLGKLDELGPRRPDPAALKLTDDERDEAVKAFKAANLSADDPKATRKLVALLSGADSPVPRLKKALDAFHSFEKESASTIAEAELMLADALVHFAWTLRYQNAAWFRGQEVPKDLYENVFFRSVLARDLLAAAEADTLPDFVASLTPPHDQYAKLQKEMLRYREIVKNGGWKDIGKASLKKGSKGKKVVELKQRLAAEGYFPPTGVELPSDHTFTDVFDDNLEQAVKDYQKTHQMDVTGESSRIFWSSINTSARDRLDAIELTLRRWQSSRIGADSHYVLVNLPDFHAEAWTDGQRDMRFRIVVGSNKFGCDADTKTMRRVNATPLQSNTIQTVIFNPYWNVPERIWQEELIGELNENPEYYEQHGYECVASDKNPCARLRQKGGDDNALGKVKFIFPNKYGTYMHDTPKKQFFEFPIRAFSHGCMRVREPMKLAEYLLRGDGQWDGDAVEKILGHDLETPMRLKTPVPIHVEYYTVRVDDDGRANFDADIYRYDRALLTGKEEHYASCEPKQYVEIGEDGRAVVEEPEDGSEAANAEGGAEGGAEGAPAGDGATPADPAGAVPAPTDAANPAEPGAASGAIATPKVRKIKKIKLEGDSDGASEPDLGP